MNLKRKIVIGIITIIAIIALPTISKAGVEVKSTGTVWTNVTISYAYDLCYNMREETSTLGKNTLDPHLALNKDWGAVSYLAMSSYGAVKNKTAPTTTGNASGVCNFGNHYTFLSGAHETGLKSASNSNYRTSLITNKDTKYVELLPNSANAENTRGMAITETSGWYSSTNSYISSTYPCLLRTGVCGFSYYSNNYNGHGRCGRKCYI